jgi:hypothetical protein
MRQVVAYGIGIMLLFACSCGIGDQAPKQDQRSLHHAEDASPVIRFDTLVNDLGTIREGEQLVAWFDYTNEGSVPLVIQEIRAGCGCTVPRWDKAPLAPGKSGSIRVVFNSRGKSGAQNIRITVQTNAENAREELYLKAIVESEL